jgi:DNA-binding NarL/FixJ family response regulator
MADGTRRASVFLVDDHPLVRESLSSLIDQQPDLFTCGEAEDAASSLREIASLRPDVAIVDISLKDSSGMELIRAIKSRAPGVAVIVLSMHDEKIYAERAMRAGARGYVMKRESTKRIIAAIRHVLQGKLALSEQIASGFAERYVGSSRSAAAESPVEDLSDRELEVFTLLGRGLETRQIAESLSVSIKTVQAYCARIKQKRQLSTASELLREAIRWNEQRGGA